MAASPPSLITTESLDGILREIGRVLGQRFVARDKRIAALSRPAVRAGRFGQGLRRLLDQNRTGRFEITMM